MKTLVIGASENKNRYAYKAICKLRASNHEVVAIGARKGKVLTVPILDKKEKIEAVDTVTLYINPQIQPEYYEYIIRLHPRRVIFNPGTENEEFYALLKAHAILYEVACTLVLLSTNQY